MANIGLGSQITTRSSSGGGGSSNSTLAVNQTTHGFSVGNAIYYTGTVWAKAQANSLSTLGVGVVTVVTDANNFTVMFEGYTSLLSGLTAGNYYFVSDITPGLLTATEPTAPTSYSNPLYFAITATTGVVLPFRPSAIVGTSTGGALGATVSTTNDSFTAGQQRTYDLSMAKSFLSWLVTEATAKKFRLQLYSTSAARTADLTRPYTVPLQIGTQHGCLLDLYIEQSLAVTPFKLSPPIVGSNADVSQATTIYATVTSNELATQNIQVTISYVPLES